MIGYHYTTAEAYKSIKAFGMHPAPSHKNELAEYGMDTNFMGTYVWDKELSPENELAILLYVATQHGSTNLVKLSIDYPAHHRLSRDYPDSNSVQYITLYHKITIGNFEMMKTEPSSHVITQYIRPKMVKLEKRFNLMDLVKG